MRGIGWIGLSACALGLIFFVACAEEKEPTGGGDAAVQRVQGIFPTSLHATREGKATFYMRSDGFHSLTGIDVADLGCQKCHAANYANGTPVDPATYTPGCGDCHVDPDHPTTQPVGDSVCLGCHSRQGAEQNLFQDVHRAAGKQCTFCHGEDQMHGTGTSYASFLASDAPRVRCQECHSPTTAVHQRHGDKLDCSACHVRSVSTCYNCHFETEVGQDKKRFFAQTPRTGFKLLMNYEGQVHTASFQALSYEGKTFVAIAPFYGHSIYRPDPQTICGDCHALDGAGNANMQEYDDTGSIVVTHWNPSAEGAARLVGPTGVIPVPANWKTSLKFDFLTYTGESSDPINGPQNLPLWDFLKTGADGSHIVYGQPLTADQIYALSAFGTTTKD